MTTTESEPDRKGEASERSGATRRTILNGLGWAHAAALAVFSLVLVMGWTWPLARLLRWATPHEGDSYINSWILHWGFESLTQLRLPWESPLFHPSPLSFTYSENLLGTTILAAPLLAVFEPLVAHNLLVLFSFPATAVAMFWAARAFGATYQGSWFAALAFAFHPWRFTQQSHLQFLVNPWLPLVAGMAILTAHRRSPKRDVALGLLIGLGGLSNLHLLLFCGATAALVLLTCAAQPLIDRTKSLARSAVVAAVVIAPVLVPYIRSRSELAWRTTLEELYEYSALPGDWLVGQLAPAFYRSWMIDASVYSERWLFPGFILLFCAVAGVVTSIRSKGSRRIGVVITVLATAGFVLSLGPNLSPYEWAASQTPLSAIRAPARWAMIAYLGLSLSAALAVSRIRLRWFFLLLLLLLAEWWPEPIRYRLLDDPSPPVYERLSAMPSDISVLELPLEKREEYRYMLYRTIHGRNSPNGASGFVPPHYQSLSERWESGDWARFLDELDKLGVDLILIHADAFQDLEALGSFVDHLITRADGLEAEQHARGIRGDWLVCADSSPCGLSRSITVSDSRQITTPEAEPVATWTTGWIDAPGPDAHAKGDLEVSGWAVSPVGIARVDLLIENRRFVSPMTLAENAYIRQLFGYQGDEGPAYRSVVSRPRLRSSMTDIQVRITDQSGEETYLPQQFLTWHERVSD